MEENKKEQMFAILCGTVRDLQSRKEYDVIETLYNKLLEYNLIHSVEDFKDGKLLEGSMEEALLYWIWRALVQNDFTFPISSQCD